MRAPLFPLLAICALGWLSTAPLIPAQATGDFPSDVAFLLDQFEMQAAPLLTSKKIDWKTVRTEFTAAAPDAKTDHDEYQLVSRLLSRLQDGHAAITQSTIKPDDLSKGRRYTGPRVHLVVSNDTVLVRAVFKDAEQAGLKPGQKVNRIDGKPALDWLKQQTRALQERGFSFSTPHQALYAACHWGLADWEGTEIAFEVTTASGEELTIKRQRNGGPNYAPIGPVFPPANLTGIGRQSYGRTADGYGYIHLRDIPGDLPQQLDQILKALGDIPGLILDMRANGGGGCDHEAVFGRFLAKDHSLGQHRGVSENPFTGPMVVIVDAGVRSAGETIAGMFKEDGRAYMIGDTPTAGTSSQKQVITTPSGKFTIRFSVRSNMQRFNNGRGIEGIGVSPHERVPTNAIDLTQREDTQIKRATELLKSGFPKDVMRYTTP
jgi:carboxyl-terminal processing protease